jgi:murein L,D-transpeptidase YafK
MALTEVPLAAMTTAGTRLGEAFRVGEIRLHSQPVLRLFFACVAVASAIVLAGCDTESAVGVNGRHMQPLSERMLAELERRKMAKESPILVRIFKEESEFEVWKADQSGRFALLKTYPICRWSGELGPKIQQGDRQAPEGFYPITPGQMNPNSNYYLAINTGFPNAYDQANGRTGQFLMIHGDCASAGCYAMTDEQIAEIYALAREAFFGGQKSFQVQAYPFRMTPTNMARHRDSPHMAFWRMLKQGYDHFEVTRLEPKIDVCEKHYVFNAQSSGKFTPAERCPAYSVPQDIVAAVRNKERRDDNETAQLVARGIGTVATTGGQGGMNATYLAALKANGGPGSDIHTAAGTIPGHVHPPAEPSPAFSTASLFGFAAPAPKPVPVQVASALPGTPLVGSVKRESAEPRPSPPATAKRTQTAADTKTADSNKSTKAKPQPTDLQKTASAEPEGRPASTTSLLTGAAPTVPTGTFGFR